MPLELLNPDGLPVPNSYTQVVVASGDRLVFVSGQVAEDEHGTLIAPGDHASQARIAFENLGRALAAAGARPADVARITIYVVDHRPEHLAVISAARVAVLGEHKPADTLIGVATLAEPGYVIEVDAVAVLG